MKEQVSHNIHYSYEQHGTDHGSTGHPLMQYNYYNKCILFFLNNCMYVCREKSKRYSEQAAALVVIHVLQIDCAK